ncbi:MAG TPA: class I SAM-dependent methyltransferase [Candidatus Acidoferrum sp.]|nr:class I SAM-dependent methyltransferase [Candidatus Acidoferrum sp.]
MSGPSVNPTGSLTAGQNEGLSAASEPVCCPICDRAPAGSSLEKQGKYLLFSCSECGLQFWFPRALPTSDWYELMYSGRDAKLLPLEPGHKYFLSDPKAPRSGELLDVGCGTGNFLAASREKGFRVSGTELDRSAASFAREKLSLENIFPFSIIDFVAQQPAAKYDVVTTFEVLEHQADPAAFLRAAVSCIRPGGYLALSVPNRDRWLTGPDVFDYPPNHFLRWNESSLRNALQRFGLRIITVRQQPVNLSYAVSMLNAALRTGLTKKVTGSEDVFFRDVMQMDAEHAAAVMQAAPTARQRLMATLGKVKRGLCYPLAAAALPYLRFRGYKAAYLYCLAQKVDSSGIAA